MQTPPPSAARCRITASISRKFIASAGAVPPSTAERGGKDMKRREQKIRAWAVIFWLFVWQAAAMLLHALYPHGALLLASPLSSLARLLSLAATKTFWQSVGTSATHIFGGFLLSCALAVMLAALSARFRRAEIRQHLR